MSETRKIQIGKVFQDERSFRPGNDKNTMGTAY